MFQSFLLSDFNCVCVFVCLRKVGFNNGFAPNFTNFRYVVTSLDVRFVRPTKDPAPEIDYTRKRERASREIARA